MSSELCLRLLPHAGQSTLVFHLQLALLSLQLVIDLHKSYVQKNDESIADYAAKRQKYTAKSQEYTAKSQEYSAKSQEYTAKSLDYVTKSHIYAITTETFINS